MAYKLWRGGQGRVRTRPVCTASPREVDPTFQVYVASVLRFSTGLLLVARSEWVQGHFIWCASKNERAVLPISYGYIVSSVQSIHIRWTSCRERRCVHPPGAPRRR